MQVPESIIKRWSESLLQTGSEKLASELTALELISHIEWFGRRPKSTHRSGAITVLYNALQLRIAVETAPHYLYLALSPEAYSVLVDTLPAAAVHKPQPGS